MSQVTSVSGMLLVILVALTLGVFITGSLSDQKTSNTGAIKISEQQDMEALIFYDALIAYNCDDTGGGLDVMPSWQEFYEHNKSYFNRLEEAGAGLECRGTSATAPGTGSIPEESVTVINKAWRNDQEGKYSKKKFIVTAEDNFNLTAKPFVLKGPEDSNLFYYPQDSGQDNRFDDVADNIKYNGETLDPDSGNIGAVTVLDIGEANTAIMEEKIYYKHGTGSGTLEEKTFARKFRFCKGTRGYIQTNTGPNPGEDESYSVSDPPGLDQEKGNQDNVLHAFIVITENGCKDEKPIGIERGDVIHHNDGKMARKKLEFGVNDGTASGGYDKSLERIDRKGRKINSMELTSGSIDGKCVVETNDGDLGNHKVLFNEGHLIKQNRSIAADLTEVELEQDNPSTWSEPQNTEGRSAHEKQLVFSRLDPAEFRDKSNRRKFQGSSGIALERFYVNDDELASKRYQARPEGDLLCADYKMSEKDSGKKRWVKCGQKFLNRDADSKLIAGGKQYKCIVGSDYIRRGFANWTKVSSSQLEGD